MNKTENRLSTSGLLRGEGKVRILRFLWESRAEWSGREIARRVGLSPPACHQALKGLYARGLVHFRRISNLHLYKVNAGNDLVRRAFAPLFEAEKSIQGQVLTAIKKSLTQKSPGAKVLSLVLFGSMARGEERLESDMDLLVVTRDRDSAKDVETRIEELRPLLSRRFGVSLSPYVQTLQEIRRKYDRKLPLILGILKDGRRLYGKDLKELLS